MRREIWRGAMEAHRTRTNVEGVDGTSAPVYSHADWIANDRQANKCRISATVSFTGGTSPRAALRVYLRNGTSVMKTTTTESLEAGSGQVFDVEADGDDVLVYVETISGSPSAWSVALSRSWRIV